LFFGEEEKSTSISRQILNEIVDIFHKINLQNKLKEILKELEKSRDIYEMIIIRINRLISILHQRDLLGLSGFSKSSSDNMSSRF